MAIETLRNLYIEQVQDLYSACTQSKTATKTMHDLADDAGLKEALADAIDGIDRGAATMAAIARRHDAHADGEHCRGMEGLVAEAKSDVVDTEFTEADVRDAAIVTQYQRMAHYAIAGYGTLLAFAKRMGLNDDIGELTECLDKSYDGDRRFSKLAETEINAAAV